MKSPKQTIVVRKDLNMRRGKQIAQACHASMKIFFDRMEKFSSSEGTYYKTDTFSDIMVNWIEGVFTKIVLGCDSLDDIKDLEQKANMLKIPYAVITDSGKTEFNGIPTVTCIALGPHDPEVLEKLTQSYSLM